MTDYYTIFLCFVVILFVANVYIVEVYHCLSTVWN